MIPLVAALLLGWAAACGSGAPATTPTPTPSPAPPTPTPSHVTLPQDDAAHQGVNVEWWYYSGHLKADDGRRYAFHYVIFQVPAQNGTLFNLAHLAVTDPQGAVYSTSQRIAAAQPSADGTPGFAFDLGGWSMSGMGGKATLSASTATYGVDLRLESQKAPALHAGVGLVDFGPGGMSYYYSRTRMKALGNLTVGERQTAVSGNVWFDHQWGAVQAQRLAWDWFALQLDDGSDLMLTLLRDAEGAPVFRYGTLVGPDGTTTHLAKADFRVTSTGRWVSPVSRATYPMGWRVQLQDTGLDLTLSPTLRESEFDATSTTQNYYWEGEVDVRGSHRGEGFVELTGYTPTNQRPAGADAP